MLEQASGAVGSPGPLLLRPIEEGTWFGYREHPVGEKADPMIQSLMNRGLKKLF